MLSIYAMLVLGDWVWYPTCAPANRISAHPSSALLVLGLLHPCLDLAPRLTWKILNNVFEKSYLEIQRIRHQAPLSFTWG